MKNWKYINGAEGIVVGNDSLTTSIEKGRLGLYNWYVHKNGSIVAGGTTDTESEAKLEAEKALKREKVGNSEIGNELNTGDFFKRLAADAHKEETRDNEKLNEIGNSKSIYPWDQNKWREIVKDPSGYSKDVVEAAKRSLYMLEHKGRAPEDDKVGNSDSLIGKTVWVRLSDGHKYKAEVLRDEGSRIYVKTPEGNQTWKLKREVEVLNEDSYEAWKNKPTKKIGNFKTGTSKLKTGDRVQSYGVKGTVKKVEGENSDNIYGEPIIEVEWDTGKTTKVGEHYLIKVGNSSHNLFLKFPSYEEAEDYINTKLKNKYKSVKVISKPHNGNGTYEIIAED